MKNFLQKLKALMLAITVSTATYAGANNAYVQLIHNCADPTADTVSVFVDFGIGQQLVSSAFAFRTATAFMAVPAGMSITAHIKAANASVSDPSLYVQALGPFITDSNYTIIASGLVGSGFAANPNALNTAFELKVLNSSRSTGSNGALIDFNTFHGVTDAAGVDVRIRSGGPLLFNNVKYGQGTSYLSIPPTYYQLEVIAEDSSSVVNTWIANFSGLGGRAATVFASGFVSPLSNNNGPALGLFAALDDGTVLEFPIRTTANFQLIHNSPDPGLATVDIYVNGAKFFDNFAFRTASPVIQGVLTANFPQRIGVAPGNSTSVNDTIWSTVLFFNTGQTYVAVASGVEYSGFAANPDGLDNSFNVLVKTPAQQLAGQSGDFDFFVVHGTTDAPSVDINLIGGGNIVDNASYGNLSSYVPTAAGTYVWKLQDSTAASTFAVYNADFSLLGGQSGVVLSSGFVTPANNNNGPAFGLFYVTSQGGPFVPFAQETNAYVQFVHNSADASVDTIDVYVNGSLTLDNFSFRTATPFSATPAGVSLSIAIAPGNSVSVGDAVATFNGVQFNPGEKYSAFISGLQGSGFASNPDAISTALDLVVLNNARNSSSNAGVLDFNAFHGCTDAPGLDLRIRSGGPLLVNNVNYKDGSSYLSLPPSYYQFEVIEYDSSSVYDTWIANFSSLAGRAATVFASGFVNPLANNNGPSLGLFAALDDGTVLALPKRTTANFQLVHNSPDTALAAIDIYVNGAKFFDNFAYRTASPVIQGVLTAEFPQRIGIAPGNSTSVNDTVWSNVLFFTTGQTYVAIASGVNGTGYAANPDGVSTDFDVLVKTPAQQLAGQSGNFDFFVVHGSPDAPTIDLAVQGGNTIIDDASYTDISTYLPVPAMSYVVDLKDGSGTQTFESYVADLSALGGQSGILLSSGFVNPGNNNGGSSVGLYLVTSQGGPFVPLPVYNSVNETAKEIDLSVYPNPATDNLFINFDLKQTETVNVQVTDIKGAVVKQVMNANPVNGKQSMSINLSDLANGMYFVRISTNDNVVNSKFNIIR